jgi:hypothetical protein
MDDVITIVETLAVVGSVDAGDAVAIAVGGASASMKACWPQLPAIIMNLVKMNGRMSTTSVALKLTMERTRTAAYQLSSPSVMFLRSLRRFFRVK